MTGEAGKTARTRDPALTQRLFSGRVLDIGSGDDLVTPQAQPFDRIHGDASRILDYLPPESFDCVHSSHCLEHLPNPRQALGQWWALVRPGGYLVLTVPDEELYEQGVWPSLFNTDHKATFRLEGPPGSPVSYDLGQLIDELAEAEILELSRQDDGYDKALCRPIGAWGKFLWRLGVWRSAVLRRLFGHGVRVAALDERLFRFERSLGQPIDQTNGDALAQIQAVLRKRPAPN